MRDHSSDPARLPVIVVGGGMLGAAVARRVAEHRPVILLEAAASLGGLTSPHMLDVDGCSIEVDRFYHVILKGDRRVRAWLNELGLASSLEFRPVGSTVVRRGHAYPASSFIQMARLPFLSAMDRFRIGFSVGIGALAPAGPWFSRVTAASWLTRVAGTSAAEKFWSPLLRAKLGPFAETVSARFLHSTFSRLLLARFQGGGADLFAVVPGGYGTILRAASRQLEEAGVQTITGAVVSNVMNTRSGVEVTYRTANGDTHVILGGEVVLTTPAAVAATILPELSSSVRELLLKVQYLGVVNVTALLREQPDPSYLTYIVDPRCDITSVIGMHTLVPPDQTAGHYLVHLPRYCAPDDPIFDLSDAEVVERFIRALTDIYPSVRSTNVAAAAVARARTVMPVPLVDGVPAPPADLGVPHVTFISAAQLEGGTLNVEATLELVEKYLPPHLMKEVGTHA